MSGLRERMNRLRGLSGEREREGAEAASRAREQMEAEQASLPGPHDRMALEPIMEAPNWEAAEISPETGNRLPEEPARDTDDTHAAAEKLDPRWGRLGVRMAGNAYGEFLLRKTIYPLFHRHGHHSLSEWGTVAGRLAAIHSRAAADGQSTRTGGQSGDDDLLQAEQVLFLDLETTGLGVGAGNVPFMVGIAYAEGGSFVVEQYLIRHPAEERAMLGHLTEKLAKFRYLVTYNGKTFDWPVMENRFIMNGMGRGIWRPLHLDLLHPSRSIWRNTLVSCRLSHVEEEKLGIERGEDVPGSLAPSIYFQFLADGNPEPLAGVFRHNELDMLSLAVLAIRFGHLLGGGIGRELQAPSEPEEMLRTGLWLEKMGRREEAEALYARVTAAEAVSPSTLLPLAARDKKAGNWQRAVLLWQKAAAAMEEAAIPSWSAHVELAMYYEHKCRDFGKALTFASVALSLAVRNPALMRRENGSKRRDELEALRKRKERLLRKTGGLIR
ncbi:ribonuclease H-like domain-containing protein [Paenibacillus beijingensis]|uniref:ribonuclease H-like domain-containing protein n=1 Tax=Paenibacillus beijingensis TaxID=1126833 RepID=UPI0006990B5D|nr:ribonuclease H-like domain-containing protein [Paenibacillus beijingensis]